MVSPNFDPFQPLRTVCDSITYLRVRSCLRSMSGVFGDYLPHVTLKGFDELGNLKAHGVLQVCLLGTAPFQGVGADQLYDVRPGIARRRRCWDYMDLAKLLEGLAENLQVYEDQCHVTFDASPSLIKELMSFGLQCIKPAEIVLGLLHQKQITPQHPSLQGLRTATVHAASYRYQRTLKPHSSIL